MKDRDIVLSIEELETLCTLYIECRLSVLEETELYYVLLKTDKESALINETRTIMGLERKVADSRPTVIRKKPIYKRFAFYGAAASVVGIILCVWLHSVDDKPVDPHTLLAQTHTGQSMPLAEAEPDSESIRESENAIDSQNVHQEVDRHLESESETVVSIPEKEINTYDDYVEITDEDEAAAILREVDDKITAILEKGVDAQNRMCDIDEKINNILNKI